MVAGEWQVLILLNTLAHRVKRRTVSWVLVVLIRSCHSAGFSASVDEWMLKTNLQRYLCWFPQITSRVLAGISVLS